MTTNNDLPGFPEKPIFDEYSDWDISPVKPVGWTATRTTNDGATIHTVGAPTITELRHKLREVTSRKAQP